MGVKGEGLKKIKLRVTRVLGYGTGMLCFRLKVFSSRLGLGNTKP